jgi:LacI family transcriptional regulator
MKTSTPAPVTIDDVAARAKVSISTVSRVLNERDRVHSRTRERVMAAVRELGYQPSAFARGLATQRTHTLGFVIPNISDPFYLEIVRGVEEAAAAEQYNLIVVSQPQFSSEHRYLQLFTQRRVDGMVLVAIDVRRHEVEHILRRGVPVALVQQDIGAQVPTFVVDNYGGASAAIEHILGHGRWRIAYITGSDFTPDNAGRLRGARDTLAAHGLELPPERIVPGNYFPDSGYAAMQRLLDLPEPPDAVFAANDQMANGAMLAIRDRGLRVPEDMIMVGFDDVSLARYTSPPLTTVHQPAYELGFQAARTVLGAIDADVAMARIVLPTALVVRQSCGCTGR